MGNYPKMYQHKFPVVLPLRLKVVIYITKLFL